MFEDITERLRAEAGRDDMAYRTVTVLMNAALYIEQLRAAMNELNSASKEYADILKYEGQGERHANSATRLYQAQCRAATLLPPLT